MPRSRQMEAAFLPALSSLRIATIWASLNRDLRMWAPSRPGPQSPHILGGTGRDSVTSANGASKNLVRTLRRWRSSRKRMPVHMDLAGIVVGAVVGAVCSGAVSGIAGYRQGAGKRSTGVGLIRYYLRQLEIQM